MHELSPVAAEAEVGLFIGVVLPSILVVFDEKILAVGVDELCRGVRGANLHGQLEVNLMENAARRLYKRRHKHRLCRALIWILRRIDEVVHVKLSDVPDERRGAHFACAAALVLPSGKEHVSEAAVYGRLIRQPRGTNGFGYDPIFVPDGSELTTAEMSPAAKDAISHRGKALRALAPVIAAMLG